MKLEKFYDKLKKIVEAYILEKKKNLGDFNDSCLLYLALGVKSNDRNNLLKSSSIGKAEVSSLQIDTLKSAGFIREIEDSGKFEITVQGIWEIEKNAGVTESDLIECIARKRFFFDTTKPMDDKEKIIIFSMICGRSFSSESRVDLIDSDLTGNWTRVLDAAFQKLSELGAIKISEKKWKRILHKQKGTEQPLSSLIRHTDALPKKVDRIYKAPGNQKYYLDVSEGDEINIEKVSYLFKKVFEGTMDLSNMDEIVDFCKQIFLENSNSLYKEGSEFSHPRYDLSLKEAAEKVIFSV